MWVAALQDLRPSALMPFWLKHLEVKNVVINFCYCTCACVLTLVLTFAMHLRLPPRSKTCGQTWRTVMIFTVARILFVAYSSITVIVLYMMWTRYLVFPGSLTNRSVALQYALLVSILSGQAGMQPNVDFARTWLEMSRMAGRPVLACI